MRNSNKKKKTKSNHHDQGKKTQLKILTKGFLRLNDHKRYFCCLLTFISITDVRIKFYTKTQQKISVILSIHFASDVY